MDASRTNAWSSGSSPAARRSTARRPSSRSLANPSRSPRRRPVGRDLHPDRLAAGSHDSRRHPCRLLEGGRVRLLQRRNHVDAHVLAGEDVVGMSDVGDRFRASHVRRGVAVGGRPAPHVLGSAVDVEALTDFATTAQVELLLIDEDEDRAVLEGDPVEPGLLPPGAGGCDGGGCGGC